MTTGPKPHPALWVPIAITLFLVAAVVYQDCEKHVWVSIASVFTAHHPDWIRYTIHLGTVVVLGLLVAARPARLAPACVVGVFLVVINTLATTRVVMTMTENPHVAVAGYEIDHVELRYNISEFGFYDNFVCFDDFSHTVRTAKIDEKSLTPPFLPLRVDWSEFETLIPELTCTTRLQDVGPD